VNDHSRTFGVGYRWTTSRKSGIFPSTVPFSICTTLDAWTEINDFRILCSSRVVWMYVCSVSQLRIPKLNTLPHTQTAIGLQIVQHDPVEGCCTHLHRLIHHSYVAPMAAPMPRPIKVKHILSSSSAHCFRL
jgi:hypothetical protein